MQYLAVNTKVSTVRTGSPGVIDLTSHIRPDLETTVIIDCGDVNSGKCGLVSSLLGTSGNSLNFPTLGLLSSLSVQSVTIHRLNVNAVDRCVLPTYNNNVVSPGALSMVPRTDTFTLPVGSVTLSGSTVSVLVPAGLIPYPPNPSVYYYYQLMVIGQRSDVPGDIVFGAVLIAQAPA
jgi:hypothetical protein